MAERAQGGRRRRSRRISEAEPAPEEPPRKKQKAQVVSGAPQQQSVKPGKKNKGQGGRSSGARKASKAPLVVRLDCSKIRVGSKAVEERDEGSPTESNGEAVSGNRGLIDAPTKFKNPNFNFASCAGSSKKRTWKNMKQILAAERSQNWCPDVPTYGSIDAPPPLKPAKKYADMTGFLAKYTDPLTRIFFNTAEEFRLVRSLPSDIVQGYLALRGRHMGT